MADNREGEFRASVVPLPQYDLMWLTFSGSLSLGKLTRTHQNYMKLSAYHDGIGELMDFRHATLGQVSLDDTMLLREYVRGQPEIVKGSNVLVVDDALQYGVGRMIAAMIEDEEQLHRSVAYTLEDGLEWLRPDQSAEILQAFGESDPVDLFGAGIPDSVLAKE